MKPAHSSNRVRAGRLVASMHFAINRRSVMWGALGLFWFGGVVGGMAWVALYDNRPGIPATAPVQWPAGSALALDAAGPTLVMLAHPRCSCTRASLTELAELLARAEHPPRTYVVFIRPHDVDGSWDRTELKRQAAAIPHVTVVTDRDGVEARRFGAATSGQTLLYGAGGDLLYSGGTTGARGHTGDNHGRAAILALLDEGHHDRSTASVFGCPLFDRELDEEHTLTETGGHDHHHN